MQTGFSSFPQARFDEFSEKLERELPKLPRQEAKLAQFMILNLSSLGLETGKSLADKVGASEVTVGRLLRRLGCDGMKGLKQLLREQYSVTPALADGGRGITGPLEETRDAEIKAVTSVFNQTQGRDWQAISEYLASSEWIYVTGFQSVRGIAEDFARRLALARTGVQFLAAHDDMLAEWLEEDGHGNNRSCLILIDVVPYASEAEKLARLAKEQGRKVIIVSDEYCHWSREVGDAVIYAPSRTGLFLESTVGIVATLGLMVDCAAKADPEEAARRLGQWKTTSKRIGIF